MGRFIVISGLMAMLFSACLQGDNPATCAEAQEGHPAFVATWIEQRSAASCVEDADCVTVDLSGDCGALCNVAVHQSWEDSLKVAAELDATSRCDRCPQDEPVACDASPLACVEGVCTVESVTDYPRIPGESDPPLIDGEEDIDRDGDGDADGEEDTDGDGDGDADGEEDTDGDGDGDGDGDTDGDEPSGEEEADPGQG